MIEVRQTVEADAEALRTIRLASLRADPTAFGRTYDEVVAYGPELWVERAVGGQGSATFLAVEDAQPVGMVAGVEVGDEPGQVELVSMWTDPSARGRGVGQLLVERVQQWAAERGRLDMALWVTAGNDAAIRLYERCGYVLTGEVGSALADPSREELRMERRRAQ